MIFPGIPLKRCLWNGCHPVKVLALFEEFQARSSAPQGRSTETNIVLARTSRLCLLPLNLGQSTEKLQDLWEFITVIFFKMSMKNTSFSPVEFEWQHYDMYIDMTNQLMLKCQTMCLLIVCQLLRLSTHTVCFPNRWPAPRRRHWAIFA